MRVTASGEKGNDRHASGAPAPQVNASRRPSGDQTPQPSCGSVRCRSAVPDTASTTQRSDGRGSTVTAM